VCYTLTALVVVHHGVALGLLCGLCPRLLGLADLLLLLDQLPFRAFALLRAIVLLNLLRLKRETIIV
jgi:hypothetical protein